jgi:hypothetical protein
MQIQAESDITTEIETTRPNKGGRPKGSVNLSTLLIRTFCREIVESEAYRDNFRERAITGKLPPVLEQMMWAYGYGKPKEHLDIHVARVDPDLAALTLDALEEKMKQLVAGLREADDLQKLIDIYDAETSSKPTPPAVVIDIEAKSPAEVSSPADSEETLANQAPKP